MDNHTDDIPVMVAVSTPPSKPHFNCVLVDKKKNLGSVFTELESEGGAGSSADPSMKVSTTESGTFFPFNERITLNQASKMLRSDILWVKFEYPEVRRVPPPGLKNAFEVLKQASLTKKSLPSKYQNPSNGLFQLFNRLVDLCKDTKVFFRYYDSILLLTLKEYFQAGGVSSSYHQ